MYALAVLAVPRRTCLWWTCVCVVWCGKVLRYTARTRRVPREWRLQRRAKRDDIRRRLKIRTIRVTYHRGRSADSSSGGTARKIRKTVPFRFRRRPDPTSNVFRGPLRIIKTNNKLRRLVGIQKLLRSVVSASTTWYGNN